MGPSVSSAASRKPRISEGFSKPQTSEMCHLEAFYNVAAQLNTRTDILRC